MQRVECGGYPPSRIQIPCHTGVEQCFLCLALLPVAIKGQPGKRCYAAGITINAISLYRGLAIVVTAAIEPQPTALGQLITQRSGNIDHTARGIPILNGGRPPNDLDSLGGIQINGIDLGLAIGQRVGDTIHLNPDTPNTEGRSGTKSASRQSEILGEVVAVLKKQARNGIEGFIQLQTLLTLTDIGCVDDRDCRGRFVQIPNQSW